MKRLTDVVLALLGLVVLFPLFLFISIWILLDAGTPVFFRQKRVGLNGRMFALLKFRSMKHNAEQSGQLTVSGRDPRITRSGFFIRRYKLDELPQLWNVLVGEMSLVGPRPEVPKYVETYTRSQKRVLDVRPGLTDLASLHFLDENDMLASADDPEAFYIREVLPQKIQLQLQYVEQRTYIGDMRILFQTLVKIIR